MRSVHIVVSGKVQGVFFRASAKQKADELQISGCVINTNKGVEIDVEGNNEAVSKFIEWCHQGPRDARVTSVNVENIEAKNYDGFNISR